MTQYASEAGGTSPASVAFSIGKFCGFKEKAYLCSRKNIIDRNMTSLTIQIEDGMSAKLKAMAEKIGVGIDSYIINVLCRAVHSETSDVDEIVKSMQLQHGKVVPAEENGKGAVADFKYSA